MSLTTSLTGTTRNTEDSAGGQLLPDLHSDSLILPPRPATPEIGLACYDDAWNILPGSPLNAKIADRREALKHGATPQPISDNALEQALDKTTHVSHLSLREAVQAFFTWELRQHPSTPHLFARQLTSDDTLDQVNSLERIPLLAKHLIATGHLPQPLNQEAGEFMLLDLSKRSRIPLGSRLLGGGAVAYASMAISPYLAAATALATGVVFTSRLSAALTRRNYNLGYIADVIETEQALEQGATPTIDQSLAAILESHPSKGSTNPRAEGFLTARALRLLEVPSLVIHEAFAINTATAPSQQALFTLLKAKLKEQYIDLSGSIVEAYEASREQPEGLAATLNALQRCYFSWGNAIRPEFQRKIHELVVALPA